MAAVNSAGRLGLSFEIQGVPQINRILGVRIKAIKDLRPAWGEVYDLLRKQEVDVFTKRGAIGEAAPESGVGTWLEWKPLKPKYAELKKAMGFGSKIMILTGDLHRSLTQKGAPSSVFGSHLLWMEFGTLIPYAAVHQRPKPTNPLPKREPIRISKVTVRGIVRIISSHLTETDQKVRANL